MANDRDRWWARLHQLDRWLDRFARLFLVMVAVSIFTVAVLMMATMDSGFRSQGGRFYVAVAAMLLLGWVASQYAWLAERQRLRWTARPWEIESGESEYWRCLVRSGMLLLLAAGVLVGLAMLLP
jgi:hypothetical protein